MNNTQEINNRLNPFEIDHQDYQNQEYFYSEFRPEIENYHNTIRRAKPQPNKFQFSEEEQVNKEQNHVNQESKETQVQLHWHHRTGTTTAATIAPKATPERPI